MSSLKSLLLSPDIYVEKHTIFGAEVYLRRLTIAELDEYDTQLKQAQENSSNTKASVAGANLILKTLCNKDGKPLPKNDLPTAEELIATKSTPSLIEALKLVQQFSYGNLDEAKKN
ncbi:phage tail protein [Arsenophonus nasoniae]|uniref:Phage tail protein n=1 Tax=Arsenophonus nasoniae TaxID=638 RepID=A0AA95GF33_9GAMM|nr:phage tail protein [Arsenophonus nasoniae]WGL93753.1 phage tail protein [Arsenophonus nasoniae]WGL96035.1 phage tail protein [Arsenophonus nasoniae]